jgi:hypothetical protein
MKLEMKRRQRRRLLLPRKRLRKRFSFSMQTRLSERNVMIPSLKRSGSAMKPPEGKKRKWWTT